jgi:hypothetical protein
MNVINDILFHMHIMWYESKMLNETLDSLQQAIKNTELNIHIKLCLNSQTYIEQPIKGKAEDMFIEFVNHPVLKNAEIIYKTNNDTFYNIGDWRRDIYSNDYKYTVWGESDTLVPEDYFYILENLNIEEPHILSLSSRKMWDDSWKVVEYIDYQTLNKSHDEIGIASCGAYINYKELCELNSKYDVNINKISFIKIDGSMLALSSNLPNPWISPKLHFHGEDTCAALFFTHHKIPQYHISTRMKGHNYNHPLKRTNTYNTRNDEIFKKYVEESQIYMNEFINNLWKK